VNLEFNTKMVAEEIARLDRRTAKQLSSGHLANLLSEIVTRILRHGEALFFLYPADAGVIVLTTERFLYYAAGATTDLPYGAIVDVRFEERGITWEQSYLRLKALGHRHSFCLPHRKAAQVMAERVVKLKASYGSQG
jgi:hypothetical protein